MAHKPNMDQLRVKRLYSLSRNSLATSSTPSSSDMSHASQWLELLKYKMNNALNRLPKRNCNRK